MLQGVLETPIRHVRVNPEPSRYAATAPTRQHSRQTAIDSTYPLAPRTAPVQTKNSFLKLPIISSSTQFQNERLIRLLAKRNGESLKVEMESYTDFSMALALKFDKNHQDVIRLLGTPSLMQLLPEISIFLVPGALLIFSKAREAIGKRRKLSKRSSMRLHSALIIQRIEF